MMLLPCYLYRLDVYEGGQSDHFLTNTLFNALDFGRCIQECAYINHDYRTSIS